MSPAGAPGFDVPSSGTKATGVNSGGGGGAAGRIRIETSAGAATVAGAIVSPSTTQLFTQDALAP
jgi:hypothetical protein